MRSSPPSASVAARPACQMSALAFLVRVSPALCLRARPSPLVGLRAMPPSTALLATAPRTGVLRMLCAGPDRTVVDTCKAKIAAALEPKELEVQGAFDDPNGSHITIYCVSDAFEGKRSLARQQLVFKAIWEEMQGPVHAVDTMVLKAPSEVDEAK